MAAIERNLQLFSRCSANEEQRIRRRRHGFCRAFQQRFRVPPLMPQDRIVQTDYVDGCRDLHEEQSGLTDTGTIRLGVSEGSHGLRAAEATEIAEMVSKKRRQD